jgi:hypothetical protein
VQQGSGRKKGLIYLYLVVVASSLTAHGRNLLVLAFLSPLRIFDTGLRRKVGSDLEKIQAHKWYRMTAMSDGNWKKSGFCGKGMEEYCRTTFF